MKEHWDLNEYYIRKLTNHRNCTNKELRSDFSRIFLGSEPSDASSEAKIVLTFLRPSNVSRLSSDGSALFKSVILVASFLHTHHCLHKDVIWMSLVGFAKLSESRSTWKEPRSFHQCLINFIGRGRHTNMRNISTPCSALMMSNMVEDVSA